MHTHDRTLEAPPSWRSAGDVSVALAPQKGRGPPLPNRIRNSLRIAHGRGTCAPRATLSELEPCMTLRRALRGVKAGAALQHALILRALPRSEAVDPVLSHYFLQALFRLGHPRLPLRRVVGVRGAERRARADHGVA